MAVLSFRKDTRISDGHRTELRAFASKAGQNVRALATRLGLRVDEEDLPDDVSAILISSPNCGSASGYRIAVNCRHSPERQRWSIAHEIGHFVLHRNDPDFVAVRDDRSYGELLPLFPNAGNSFRNGLRNRLEREAECFAADLLMPAHLVKASASFRVLSIPNLANQFFVSRTAMQNRVKDLLSQGEVLPQGLASATTRWCATAPA